MAEYDTKLKGLKHEGKIYIDKDGLGHILIPRILTQKLNVNHGDKIQLFISDEGDEGEETNPILQVNKITKKRK
jgi:hypothetical protein